MRLGQAGLCQVGAGDLDRVRADADGSSMWSASPGGLWPRWREIRESGAGGTIAQAWGSSARRRTGVPVR